MPDYPSLIEEQSKEVMLDTNDFIIEQLSSTPFHIRLGLTFIGFIFLFLILAIKSVQGYKKEKQSDSSIILSVISLNKYISSFARVYRSLFVLGFYEHPKVKKIINS
mgnify:CR=1 FL=1